MAKYQDGNFLDFVHSSGSGASGLFGAEHQTSGFARASGDLIFFDETSAAKGGKGPNRPGPVTEEPEPVTDIYITGQADGVDDSLQYNIEVQFVGEWSLELKAVFVAAADYLASLIATDLPDAIDGNGTLYDDLVITADLDAIDGVGGVLGQAGPTGLRSDTGLPAVGEMTFDEADAVQYYEAGLFDDIVLHEMIHVMGFGTLWDYNNLVSTEVIDDNGTRRPNDDIIASVYTGDAANTAFNGAPTTDDLILVETDGGAGTAGGHWDEETYFDELMTGFIGYVDENGTFDNTNYLSDWSVASLQDLGYELTVGAVGIADNIVLI